MSIVATAGSLSDSSHSGADDSSSDEEHASSSRARVATSGQEHMNGTMINRTVPLVKCSCKVCDGAMQQAHIARQHQARQARAAAAKETKKVAAAPAKQRPAAAASAPTKPSSSSKKKSASKVSRAAVKAAVKSSSSAVVASTARVWPIPRELIAKVDGSDSEDFCFKCREEGLAEEDGVLLPCRGICAHSWHLSCVGFKDPPPEPHWICDSCAQGFWPKPARLDSECEQDDGVPNDEEKELAETLGPEWITKRTILMAACGIHEKTGRHTWIRHLTNLGHVRKGIKEGVQDELGYTVLHHGAVEHVPPSIMLKFLEIGADPNIPDLAKTMAIHHAFSRQNIPGVLALLTSRTINLRARSNGTGFEVFAECAGPAGNFGLGPGKKTQGIQGFYRFQLYFAFCIRFIVQQEYLRHKTFHSNSLTKKLAQLRAAATGTNGSTVKAESSSSAAAAAAVKEETIDPSILMEAERAALFEYLEERLSTLSLNMLQFIRFLIKEGLSAAKRFKAESFQQLKSAAVEGGANPTSTLTYAPKSEPPAASSSNDPMDIDSGDLEGSSPGEQHTPAAASSSSSPTTNPSSNSKRKSLSGSSAVTAKTLAKGFAKEIMEHIKQACISIIHPATLPSAREGVDAAVEELQAWLKVFGKCEEFSSTEHKESKKLLAPPAAAESKKRKQSSSSSARTDPSEDSDPQVKRRSIRATTSDSAAVHPSPAPPAPTSSALPTPSSLPGLEHASPFANVQIDLDHDFVVGGGDSMDDLVCPVDSHVAAHTPAAASTALKHKDAIMIEEVDTISEPEERKDANDHDWSVLAESLKHLPSDAQTVHSLVASIAASDHPYQRADLQRQLAKAVKLVQCAMKLCQNAMRD